MSRVTAPFSKFSRAIGSTSAPTISRTSGSLLDSATHRGGTALMPKYAELLQDGELSKVSFAVASSTLAPACLGTHWLTWECNALVKSRGITTTHRPTPQPSIVNRPRPLMQTFHSNAARAAVSAPSTHLDAMMLPSMDWAATSAIEASGPRMPLLPDNYGAAHTAPQPAPEPAFSKPAIFAAEPGRVAPATPLSAVEGLSMDGIDLKFVHTPAAAETNEHSHMIRDMWKGITDDAVPVTNTN